MRKGQVYGIPTYDALFKWVLSSDLVRPSFFHAFIPNIVVQSSERLDDHMNPKQELQLLRETVNAEETTQLVDTLHQNQTELEVHLSKKAHKKATNLLKTLLRFFPDIQYSFPKAKFDGKMDFVCKLESGEYALVEMQVIPEENWDGRALGYVAAYYGNQLRKSESWKDIKKVIGINILGGGRDDSKHWTDTPEQYVRHYKFQEQIHNENPPRYIEGLEIIQYSLSNVPKQIESQEQKDWLCFFRNAHMMTEEDVKREIKTPAVLDAFELAKFDNLPKIVTDNYHEEDARYVNLTTHMEELRAKGREEGRIENQLKIAKKLILRNVEEKMIAEITDLPLDAIIALRDKKE
jgi:predicted transposase/invertase (TIGR01784 family)